MQPMPPPSDGLVISERLAGKLRVRPGDLVEIELTEDNGRRAEVVVSALAESFVGLRAYMAMDALDRLTRQGNRLSGVNLSVDPDAMEDLYRSVKETPAIASIALQNLSRSKFRETIEQNIITMTSVYVALAVIITFGVIYNASRIQFSERARELASLRVMGFTRREVVLVLLIEVALIVVLSQPLGWFLGWGFAKLVVAGFESDLFKVPLIIKPSTYAISSLVVVLAASASAILVWRRVARLDMVRALKTKE
jgi:putative ABC transport system permease protein